MDGAKHTPGPWVLHQNDKWPFEIQIGNDVVTMSRVAYSTAQKTLNDVRLAVGFDWHERDNVCRLVAEQEANARLIAAAPELLSALEEALLQLDYLEGRNTTGTTPAVAARIRHVIAKAKG
jgi:hypothetical protein